MTDAEKVLWSALRGSQLGASFRKQHPAGPYVLDFYCSALKLAIELDGDQHGWAENAAGDAKRDEWLVAQGVNVLRFTNVELLRNRDGVLETIHRAVETLKRKATPTPALPLSGGGDEDSRFGEIDR